MQDMMKALEQNRIQVHDMHHMIILGEYAFRKKSMKDRNLSGSVTGKLCRSSGGKMDKNPESDILLSEKKKEANLENIRFQIEADVLQNLPFRETETDVLFEIFWTMQ